MAAQEKQDSGMNRQNTLSPNLRNQHKINTQTDNSKKRFRLSRAATHELLLQKETLSLPDIVDTLGDRPYAVKESITEYLTELRARNETVDEVRNEEEAKADAKRKAAIDATKFDPDAEVPEASETEDSASATEADGEDKKAAAGDESAEKPAADEEEKKTPEDGSDKDKDKDKKE